jgi:hypothetical protein
MRVCVGQLRKPEKCHEKDHSAYQENLEVQACRSKIGCFVWGFAHTIPSCRNADIERQAQNGLRSRGSFCRLHALVRIPLVKLVGKERNFDLHVREDRHSELKRTGACEQTAERTSISVYRRKESRTGETQEGSEREPT